MIIHTLPRRDTQRYQLLELIALSGDFPAELLSRLPGGSTYKESVVKSLKREGLIRTFYRDHLRTYRLTAKAKAQLMAEQPDRFAFYLEGNSDTNLLKGEITRRLRLYQNSSGLCEHEAGRHPHFPGFKTGGVLTVRLPGMPY